MKRKPKGRTQRTYNLKINKIKKRFNKAKQNPKNKLKNIEFYIDKIKKPNK